MVTCVDSVHIQLVIAVDTKDYHALSSRLEKRISFISDSNEGKYGHSVKMPWEGIETNADSVRGTDLFWQPPVTKFLLTDYTMYAKSRRLSYWTLIVSGLVIITTLFVFYKRKRIPKR